MLILEILIMEARFENYVTLADRFGDTELTESIIVFQYFEIIPSYPVLTCCSHSR